MRISSEILLMLLRLYKVVLSPVLTTVFGPLGLGCRYTPTCSEYAHGAIREHGVLVGLGLTFRRLARCHPWGGWGHDPVPPGRDRAKTMAQTCCHHGS